jgi:ATP-dependent DNA helicase PIF1
MLTILDKMMSLHSGPANSTKMISVDSPAGGGKTFLLNLALAMFRSRGEIAIATASTGIAAMLLAGGGTAHSRFGIPVPVDNSSVSNIKVTSTRADILRKAAILIWDEVTMADKKAIECVDRLLREVMASQDASLDTFPFGGKLIIFSGNRSIPNNSVGGIYEMPEF